MEIRAKITLAIEQFKANANAVGSIFKSMTSDAEQYSKNVDRYIQKNLENRLQAIEQAKRAEQRALQFSSASTQKPTAKSGSTELNFGLMKAQRAQQVEALSYVSQITQAERKATAESIALNRQKNQAIAKSENDRYQEWLRINTAQSAAERKLAEQAKQRQATISFIDSKQFDSEMPRIRYALYDIGNRALALAGTIATAGVQMIQTVAQFESAFTRVERTTGLYTAGAEQDLENLRKKLIEISTTIPVAFQDVANIATLGAQMGIAAESLADFTNTVAQFSTITGISAEQTATAFGRLSQLLDVPVTKFENLSSAIAFAGVNSVATDREILAMAESIAAAGNQAGLSADQVIGLSTALASLKVRPEEARGVIVRLFREIDLEVSAAGRGLRDFATVLGMTAEDTAALWKQDPNAFLTAFLKAAGASGKLNETITALGITNSRELNVIQRLANNTDVLAQSLSDAEEQYLLGTYAAEAYGLVSDDLASRWQVLINTLSSLVDEFGRPLAELLSPIIKFVSDILNGFKGLPPVLVGIIALIVSLTGIFAAGFGGLALLIAGLLAMKTAMNGLTVEGTKLGINFSTLNVLLADMGIKLSVADLKMKAMAVSSGLLSRGLQAVGVSSNTASIAASRLSAAFGWISLAGVALVAIFQAIEASNTDKKFNELGAATLEANGGITNMIDALKADTEAMNQAAKAGEDVSNTYGTIGVKFDQSAAAAYNEKQAMLEAAGAHEDLIDSVKNSSSTMGDAADALEEKRTAEKAANDETQRGIDLTKEQTFALGDNIKAQLLASLRKYSKGDGEIGDFILEQVQDPGLTAALEAFGFDVVKAIDESMAKASTTGTGASDYLTNIEGQFDRFNQQLKGLILDAALDQKELPLSDAIAEVGRSSRFSEEKIKALQAAYAQVNYTDIFNGTLKVTDSYKQSTAAIDGQLISLQSQMQANTKASEIYQRAGVDIAGVADETGVLTGQLESSVNAITNTANAVSQTDDALVSFAKSAKDGKKTLKGLSDGARDNAKNWRSFVDNALKKAIETGSGATGLFTDLAAAIKVMGDAGIDTSVQFGDLQKILLDTLETLGPGYATAVAEIEKAPDLSGLQKIVAGLIAAEVAAGRMGGAVYTQLTAIAGALNNTEAIDRYKKIWGSAATSVGGSADKMKEAVDRAFSAIEARMSTIESIDKLGQSLRDNGASFTLFSQGGRDNINALIDVIKALEVEAGDSPKKLANNLMSLRQALINTGFGGARALRLIDKALREVGVSGKKSRAAVKQFADAIRALTNQQQRVVALANAMESLANSVMDFLNARWMLGNVQMEIAAGWEEIANRANDAQQAVEDANRELAQIAASKGILEYQLQIALKYGDTLRAAEIQAQIDELNAQAEQAQQNAASASTTPARDLLEQQQALQQMVGYYVQLGAAEVIGAKNKKEAKAAIKGTVEAFKEQARAAGVSEENVKKYAKELRQGLKLARELNKPAQYKIDARTQRALNQIRSFADEAKRLINSIPNTVTIRASATVSGAVGASTGGLITGPGSSTSDSISARLSNGEYVVKADAVKYYGTDFMNSLNNASLRPSAMSFAGAVIGGGSQVVYLSPEDRQLLRAAIDRPINLFANSTKIASTANAGNVILAQRGTK